jgi:[ribosomal protein S18]-alanine N-acetyltransferase
MNLGDLPYVLDRMQLSDLPTISHLERQVFTTPWSIQAYRQELLYHDMATYLVVRHTGEPDRAGGALLRRPWGTRHDPTLLSYGGVWMLMDEAHVCTLAVRPEWRGRGLGELVFAALIERAFEQQATMLTLEVRISNRAAQSLYAKYGLETAGLRRRYYPDNQEDALIMTTPPLQTEAFREAYHARVDALLQRLRQARMQDREGPQRAPQQGVPS